MTFKFRMSTQGANEHRERMSTGNASLARWNSKYGKFQRPSHAKVPHTLVSVAVPYSSVPQTYTVLYPLALQNLA